MRLFSSLQAIICLLILLPVKLTGQHLLFESMESRLELPTDECYHMLQDKNGYIWIATERGISRYNGRETVSYGKHNGLNDISVYDLAETRDGKLLALTSASRIMQLQNDSFIQLPCSKAFTDAKKNVYEIYYALDFLGDTALLLTGNINTKVINLKTGSHKRYGAAESDSVYYYLQWENDRFIHYKSSENRASVSRKFPSQKGYFLVNVMKGNRKITIRIPFTDKFAADWRFVTANDNIGNTYFAANNYVVQVASDLSYRLYPIGNRVLSLFCDKDNGLWVSTYKSGLYYYPSPDKPDEVVWSLRDQAVGGVLEDHENGIWCFTLNNSVAYSKSKYIVSYADIHDLEKGAAMLTNEGSTVFAGNQKNQLFVIKNGKPREVTIAAPPVFDFKTIMKYDNGWILGGVGGSVFTDSAFKLQNTIYDEKNSNIPATLIATATAGNGSLWAIQYDLLMRFNTNNVEEKLEPKSNRALAIIADTGNWLIYGGRKGLARYNVLTGVHRAITCPENPAISDICRLKNGQVLIACSELGLYRIAADGMHLEPFSDFDFGGSAVDITEDKNSNIWVCNYNTIFKITRSAKGYSYKVFHIEDGFPRGDMTDLVCDENYLYCNSSGGLYRFNRNIDFTSNTNPLLKVVQVSGNGLSVSQTKSSYVFESGTRTISFDCDVLSYRGKNPAQLEYQLMGEDQLSGKSPDGKLMFYNLPPGSYELLVWPQAGGRSFRERSIRFVFEIRPAFWQSSWFYFLSGFLLACIIYLLFRYFLIRIRRKETEKARINTMIAEYRLSALQTQINPHFIFNVINSIQVYILENDTLVAYDYLARFSKLMRIVLNMARQKTHTLESELELLTMYIDLEQLRFEKRFICEIDVDPELNTHDFRVLPMLFQPFVENAIWHGLLPLKNIRPGKLKIAFRKNGTDSVFVIIEDNGIGREAAGRISRHKSHHSVAVSLNQERLQILSQVPGFDSSGIHIIDLKDAAGNACGTRVEITLTALTDSYD